METKNSAKATKRQDVLRQTHSKRRLTSSASTRLREGGSPECLMCRSKHVRLVPPCLDTDLAMDASFPCPTSSLAPLSRTANE
jgi:hypothetical protein